MEPNNVDWKREFETEMTAEARMQSGTDEQLEYICSLLREHGDDLNQAAEVSGKTMTELQWWLNNFDEPKLARIWAKYRAVS